MKIFSLLLVFVISGTAVFSQTGDFRTITGGTWSTATTWERDADQNGTFEESPSTVAPNSLSDEITIQAGHTVTLTNNVTINGTLTIQNTGALTISAAGAPADRLTISSTGTLNNLGTLTMAGGLIKRMRVNGVVNNSGTMNGFNPTKLFFEANSIYDHQFTSTAGTIPLATWNTSSTCQITGYTSAGSAPANLSQGFGNFTWNCVNQTAPIDLAGSLTTINGNLNLLNTGFIGVFLDQSGSNTTIDVSGNLIVEEYFIVSETGTGNILNVSGSAILTNNTPYLVLSGASGDVTLNVAGDVSLDNGGFIDMSQAGVGNSVVNLGGDLSMANFSYITTGFGTGNYTINFNGSSEQILTASLNELFDGQDVNILSGAILSIANNNFLGTSGDFNLANNAELRVGSTAASGAIQTSGSGGNIRVTGTQTYTSGSTIVYNGLAAQFIGSGYPSTAGVQLEINNANGVSLVSNVTIGDDLTLNAGNLSVGSNLLTLRGSVSGAGSIAVTSNSDIIVNGTGVFGTFPFLSATPTLNDFTIDRAGESVIFEDDVTITGILSITQGDLDFRGRTLNLSGTITGSGNIQSNASSTLNITGSGAFGTLQFDPTANTIGTLSFNRNTSGTAALQGTLTVNNALTLLNGELTNSASLFMADNALLTKNSNAVFLGNSPETTGGALYDIIYTNAGQTTGSEIPAPTTTDALGDLTIQTSGAVVLDQSLQVNNAVTLQTGSLTIGANTLSVGGDWTRNGGALNAYTGLVIFNGTTTIGGSSAATFVNFQVDGTSSVTMPAGNININGNIQISASATFNANGGTVTLGTTSDPNIAAGGATFNNIAVNKASGTVSITSQLNLGGRMTFSGSSTATIDSQDNLTIISTSDAASGNGSIGAVPSGVSFVNNFTVQRFMSGEGRIYRYLSSPVVGANFEQWRDDFPITGTFSDPSTGPGIRTNNPSLYLYDESNPGTTDTGWEAHPTTGALATHTIEVGRGYAAFIREDVASTVVDVTGTLNVANVTDIDLGVTYNDSGEGPTHEGWNLVGNPFPSSIDWDNILSGTGGTITNVDNGIHVRDNGAGGIYRTWDGSVGDLENGEIATAQAFWVRANAVAPILTVNEQAKTASTGAFYRTEEAEKEVIQVSLSNGTITDNAFISFDDNATLGYDSKDTPNLDNVSFDISSYTEDSISLAINYIGGFTCSSSLPLNIQDVSSGSYTLEFSQLESIVTPYQISLHDNYLDTNQDIFLESTYTFNIDSTDLSSYGNQRFALEITTDFELHPEIAIDGDKLASNYSEGNQWYLNGEPIATTQEILPMESGLYELEVILNDCVARTSLQFEVTGLDIDLTKELVIFPNPFQDKFKISSQSLIQSIEIYGTKGNKIYTQALNTKEYEVNSQKLSKGVYIVRVITNDDVILSRIVKE
ncbi:T9SS type A sorting domain-containing protein [Fulvivirga sp. RKSG066]|uniref:T9SS type A sorting domain-containing protein n=1 Tax=Fulvivirga aurantia TaxID=2529383 RepID=UPI0012BBDBC2|nr:T9SS type A sorting domain-containing protein [Fulvivirga aurantia]MTI20579.1 T9SS type A sorting domain-containing protein [Fulvivirga aurantia]